MALVRLGFAFALLAPALPATAQAPTKLYRIGVLLNMKTAKALGLTIPAAVRLRADRVIE